MAHVVTTGGAIACSMGAAPATFTATGVSVRAGSPVGAVTDVTPASVPGFGMCSAPANPQVAAATAAAMGVLTPQPCVPVIVGPWSPGSSRVTVAGVPALDDASTCACGWGGSISVTSAGQADVTDE